MPRKNSNCGDWRRRTRPSKRLGLEQRAGSCGRAAVSTVEALGYQLRRGGAGVSNLKARQRPSELGGQELHEVSARLQKFMPHIARAWSPSEVELLVQLWSDLHG